MAFEPAPAAPDAGCPAGDALPPASSRRAEPRGTFAALDLGTNNCRLLIARPAQEGFAIVDAFSRIVRLGEGLATTGRLSEAAMDRAVTALAVCADKLVRRHVTLVRSVATEACRRADNGSEFAARVREETGIRLEIITAEQEARLAMLGCHALLEPGKGPALIFDIGGGSTELILIEPGEDGATPRVLDWCSAPWGVVSLSEHALHDNACPIARRDAYQAMRDCMNAAFAPFAAALAEGGRKPRRLLGTSGTVTTLASLHLELAVYDRRVVDGVIVPADAMRAISARLAAMAIPDRARLPCIGQERADLVVAGCAILETILDLWPVERLGVADRGIREGILRSLMAGRRPAR